jgi:hypothetical protein
MGSLTSPETARHQVSGMWFADLPTNRPTPLLRDNHRPVELPSCVTPSAHRAPLWFAPVLSTPKGGPARELSIGDVGPCGRARVREYQPVIHRLRLSASP